MQADRWRLVMHHQPIYSESPGGHGSTLRLQERWLPVIDAHRVDLVLAGHDHNYQRSRPLRAGAVDPAGTTFVVTAGGGAPLYEVGQAWWTAAAWSGYHFLVLRIRRRVLAATAYDELGNVIDSFMLWKGVQR